MKRRTSRWLSILLTLCMTLALLPGTVWAEDAEEDGIMPLTTIDDHIPPAVTGVYMANPGGTVTVGDVLYFTVSTEDESGIYRGILDFTFVCEQGHRHTISAYGYQYQDFYDEETKQAKFDLTITDDMLNGTYTLSSVRIYDTYSNSAYYYPADPDYPYDSGNPGNIDFDKVCFTVEGSSATEDHDPPVVTAVSMEEPGKVVTVGDVLYFTVSTEDESGIYRGILDFTFVCEQGHRHTISAYGYQYQDFYDEETKQAKFDLTITNDMLNGTYTLSSVRIYDTYSNSAYYYPADPDYPYDSGNPGNIDFDAVYFTIATPDIVPVKVSIPEKIEVDVRSVYTIRPNVEPIESIPDWTWTSADTSIATVNSAENNKTCLVTGIAPGTTTITGTTQNNLTVSCEVTVTNAPLPESGTIDESYTVGVGGFADIVPVLTPSDATTLYEVSSNNPHVAGIELTNGGAGIRISGINAGTATITIRGSNNLVMTTTVTVGRPNDTPHEKRTIEGYPATCVRAGRTDSVVCSVCWYVFTEDQEIPATGEHTWSEWHVIQAATTTTAGVKERYCEICGERETETIPATGSSSGNSGGSGNTGESGSSGSGSGSSGNSGSSGGASNNSVGSNSSTSVTSDGQDVLATVKGGTAEITNSSENIDSILEGAKNGAVHIDASAREDVTEVAIPRGVLDAISESETVSAVSITTKTGTVELHEEALKTVSGAMTGDNDTVSIEVSTIDVNSIPSTQKYPIANVLNSAVFINLSASIQHKNANGQTTSTETIHEFGGSVTVSIPYELPANMEGRQIIACHIADDGTITYFPVKYENGVVTFTTTHFSLFGVLESRAADFRDIDISAWYMLSVEYVLNSGLMDGVGNQQFNPSGTTTRGMLMTILARLAGVDTSVGNPWYQPGMEWAMAEGVSDGTNPEGEITREQLTTMLWRYAGEPEVTGDLSTYPDADQVHSWASDAMIWAVQNGIIDGIDGKLEPQGNAFRSQAAAMLTRFCKNIVE